MLLTWQETQSGLLAPVGAVKPGFSQMVLEKECLIRLAVEHKSGFQLSGRGKRRPDLGDEPTSLGGNQ